MPDAAIGVVETKREVAVRALKDRVEHLVHSGSKSLIELDKMLARVATDDWSFSAMRGWMENVRRRAETGGEDVLRVLDRMPGRAVAALAAAGRARVQYLTRSLMRVESWLESPGAPAPATAAEPETRGAEQAI